MNRWHDCPKCPKCGGSVGMPIRVAVEARGGWNHRADVVADNLCNVWMMGFSCARCTTEAARVLGPALREMLERSRRSRVPPEERHDGRPAVDW